MIATHAVPMTTAADLAKRQAWVEKCFTTAATLPLSFVLDEKRLPAFQPERGNGFLQAIRLLAAPQACFTMCLQGIDPAAYRFENAETGETRNLSGQDLHRDGFPVTLPARSGVIWFYQRTHR